MTLAFSACGATATPEQELMERAESYYSEINRQNWSDARKYLAPSIQKVCPSEDFTVAWFFATSLIRGFADISANEPITYKVKNVSVNGSQGTVYGSVLAKGKELFDEEDSGDPWVYSEGEWWNWNSEWLDGCKLGSTGDSVAKESTEVVASSECVQKPAAVPTSSPVVTVIPTTLPLPSPIPTEPPVTAKTFSLKSSGQCSSEVFFLEYGLHIARVKASSSELIAIHMSNEYGNMVGEPLVSRMGPFDTFNGSTAFGVVKPGNYILEVDIDGDWEVEILSDTIATDRGKLHSQLGASWEDGNSDLPISMKGDTQAASELFRLEEGSYVAQIKVEGKGYFSVWLMNALGEKVEHLIDGFGPFDGSVAFDIDINYGHLFNVISDGKWSITIDKSIGPLIE
tara:strand:- start:335 stop:1531 length:1197 start_codon:yes stop_codon:yes gene_type:complete